jgi:hypothetical protein
MGEKQIHTVFCVGIVIGRNHFRVLDADDKITLKLLLENWFMDM